METSGFTLLGVTLAGSRPGGRLTSLRRQRSKQERRPRRAGRGFSESPSVSARACLVDANAETPVDSLMTQGASVKARCLLKAPSEPPSSGALGGAFRRSCLSPRSGRVLRRPHDASSAGESSAKPTTGEAASPSLPTFLATQESRPPAGARPGQRNAQQRKAPGPHQRAAIPGAFITSPCTTITRSCYSITIAFYRIMPPRACSTRGCDPIPGGRVFSAWPCGGITRPLTTLTRLRVATRRLRHAFTWPRRQGGPGAVGDTLFHYRPALQQLYRK